LPRKYHRPPTVKRRKPKKTAPYVFQGTPEPGNGDATELVSPEEELEEDEERYAGSARAPAVGGRGQAGAATKHLVKDYSYVRAEIVRILGLAAFLIVSLAITAILRG